jgi:hypothetical protein
MINSLELTGKEEANKTIIGTIFEYLAFSLKKYISERIGKNNKGKTLHPSPIRRIKVESGDDDPYICIWCSPS